MVNRERIARKVAQDIKGGTVVNFGHGIPFSVMQYIDKVKKVCYQNEGGLIGFELGAPPEPHKFDLTDTSNSFVSDLPCGAYLSGSDASFAMIRGGHIDVTVLGALQVDEYGSIANWRIPGQPATGIGGAMDLCVGCKEVWAAMESTTKDGNPRLVSECTYPLTAIGKVRRVYTEFGVLSVSQETGFTLEEYFPDHTIEQIKGLIAAKINISKDVKEIDLNVPLQ